MESIELIKKYRFNSNVLPTEVRKLSFQNQKSFAKLVHSKPKISHKVELFKVDTFSEAYDFSKEVLNIMITGLALQSGKRFVKHAMQLKTSTSISKVDNKYAVFVQYR